MKNIKKYKSFYLLIFTVFVSAFAFAQEEIILKDLQSQQLVQKYELSKAMLSDASNQAFIQQIGDENQSNILQDARNYGGANMVLVFQSGNYNVVNAAQKGYSNDLRIVQQGNANETAITAEGELLKMVTLQYGDGNKVAQQVNGTGVNYDVLQVGNNNTIEQKGDSFSKGYSITQYGNNMNVTIERISVFK